MNFTILEDLLVIFHFSTKIDQNRPKIGQKSTKIGQNRPKIPYITLHFTEYCGEMEKMESF
jgi:hypothetical protein